VSSELKIVFEGLADSIAGAVRGVLWEYFGSPTRQLHLSSSAKVVARIEVREPGAYLDLELGEAGYGGKIYLHTTRDLTFASDVPSQVEEPASPSSANHHVRLTRPQAAELARQVRLGPQPTYGKGRARVQNNLVRFCLSRFSRDGTECSATELGREISRLLDERKKKHG